MDAVYHQKINRPADNHGDAYGKHHADKIVYHADHVDSQLNDNEQHSHQRQGDNVLYRPFLCVFHFDSPLNFSRFLKLPT